MPSGVYERKPKDPNAPILTTREKLKKRVFIAFKVLDYCLKGKRGIKPLQFSAAKWVIESDLVKVKEKESIPEYDEKVLKEYRDAINEEGKKGNESDEEKLRSKEG